MKVYVVTEDYWNGESSAKRVSNVFVNKADADAYASARNAARCGSYDSEYEVEEFDVK